MAEVRSFVLVGAVAHPVTIEVELLRRLPAITITGLPASAAKEMAEIVRSSIEVAEVEFPRTRVVVNVRGMPDVCAPSSVFGLAFPIAVAVLVAAGIVPPFKPSVAFVGALDLAGRVLPARGTLAAAVALNADGTLLFTSVESEIAAAGPIRVAGVHDLGQFVTENRRNGDVPALTFRYPTADEAQVPALHAALVAEEIPRAVLVQFIRAMQLRRPLLLVGKPGTGKTRIARALRDVLGTPQLSEFTEIATIADAAGLAASVTGPGGYVRPFRAPHHTISREGATGDLRGRTVGEVHLAHRGILFLDEVHEFQRIVLEAIAHTHRDRATATSPADFVLVAATTPDHVERVDRLIFFEGCPRVYL